MSTDPRVEFVVAQRDRDQFVHEYLHDAPFHAVVEVLRPHIEADLRERIAAEIEAMPIITDAYIDFQRRYTEAAASIVRGETP